MPRVLNFLFPRKNKTNLISIRFNLQFKALTLRAVQMEYYRNNFKTRLKGYLKQRYRSSQIEDLDHDQCHEVLTVLQLYLRHTPQALKRREIETFIEAVNQQAGGLHQALL